MKFKVMALAAMIGLSAGAVQANELPNGPHIVTSGTASSRIMTTRTAKAF